MGVVPIVIRSQLTQRRMAKPHKLYFAFTILNEFADPLSEADEALFDIIYYNLPGSDRDRKRTWRHRYAQVDAIVCEEIAKRFADQSSIEIHDMAASNAITSLDLYEALRLRLPEREFKLHASDLYDRVDIVYQPNASWKVAFDATGRPLQFIGRRTVLPIRTNARIGKSPRQWLNWWLVRRLLPKVSAIRATAGPNETISLFHPRVQAADASDQRFTLGRHDLFQREDRTYDVVRLMSTVKSLPLHQIGPLFLAISASVPSGGLLVAGQNRDPQRAEHIPTTIFRRDGNRFTAVREVMGGYDCRDLVLGLELPPGNK